MRVALVAASYSLVALMAWALVPPRRAYLAGFCALASVATFTLAAFDLWKD